MKPGLHLTVGCIQCGKEYRQWRIDHKFCSSYCALKNWRITNWPRERQKIRERDKVLIQKRLPFTCGGRGSMGLSVGGPTKAWSKGKEYVARRTCEICKELFYAPPKLIRRGGGRFCSYECRGKEMAARMAGNPASWPTGGQKRGKTGRREDLGGLFVRSRWEANWARYLEWMKNRKEIVDWKYEPDTFEFKGIKRGSRFYTPDFKVTEKSGEIIYHEIKGYMDQKSATKLKRMAKYYPKVKIKLIAKQEYYALRKAMGNLLPNWEVG